ncbi:uncharacterized protein [Antedon mediterranea]|uniref:uncharacterized protein n=1 Tax=Antedon mediterranea TaxID=105859 RepID=UPI003AF76332
MADAGSYEISTWNPNGSEVQETVEEKPVETKPVETKPVETKPAEGLTLRRPYKPGEQPMKTPPAASWQNMSSGFQNHSSLNPNAKAFTPGGAVPKAPPVYNQRLLPVVLDPTFVDDPTLVRVPSMEALQPTVLSVPSEDNHVLTGATSANVDIISNVKDVLNVMSINPGCFDEYIEQLVIALNTNPLDLNQLDNLVEFIYEQAIFDTNFTYTAAKVCNCLSKKLLVQPGMDSDLFRNILMDKLKKEFHERETALTDPILKERLYRFTMFIADLFLNMDVMTNNKPRKIDILRKALNGLMESFLKYPDDENAKMLIRLLKLTGAQADDFDRETGGMTSLQNLFSTIRNIILDNKLQRKTRETLLSLIELRASNWGRDTMSPAAQQMYSSAGAAAASGDSAVGVADLNDYTFYAPDGRVISQEEASIIYVNESDLNNMDEFLTNKWSLGNNEKSQRYNDDDYYTSESSSTYDQGLNDEEYAAYEEFTRCMPGGRT